MISRFNKMKKSKLILVICLSVICISVVTVLLIRHVKGGWSDEEQAIAAALKMRNSISNYNRQIQIREVFEQRMRGRNFPGQSSVVGLADKVEVIKLKLDTPADFLIGSHYSDLGDLVKSSPEMAEPLIKLFLKSERNRSRKKELEWLLKVAESQD